MIPTNPPPTFTTPDLWSASFRDFVSKCLVKNPETRATATQLLQVRGSTRCFHDTFAMFLCTHACEKPPDESFKNLPAVFERFFQVQMFPSPLLIMAILRFCSVPVVTETLQQTQQ